MTSKTPSTYLPFTSEFEAMELVLDILYDAKKQGIKEISMSEIMHFLGVPDKHIDRKNNPVYDLTDTDWDWFPKTSDAIMLRFQTGSNNCV